MGICGVPQADCARRARKGGFIQGVPSVCVCHAGSFVAPTGAATYADDIWVW